MAVPPPSVLGGAGNRPGGAASSDCELTALHFSESPRRLFFPHCVLTALHFSHNPRRLGGRRLGLPPRPGGACRGWGPRRPPEGRGGPVLLPFFTPRHAPTARCGGDGVPPRRRRPAGPSPRVRRRHLESARSSRASAVLARPPRPGGRGASGSFSRPACRQGKRARGGAVAARERGVVAPRVVRPPPRASPRHFRPWRGAPHPRRRAPLAEGGRGASPSCRARLEGPAGAGPDRERAFQEPPFRGGGGRRGVGRSLLVDTARGEALPALFFFFAGGRGRERGGAVLAGRGGSDGVPSAAEACRRRRGGGGGPELGRPKRGSTPPMRPAIFATPPMRAKVEPDKFWRSPTPKRSFRGFLASSPTVPCSPARLLARRRRSCALPKCKLRARTRDFSLCVVKKKKKKDSRRARRGLVGEEPEGVPERQLVAAGEAAHEPVPGQPQKFC